MARRFPRLSRIFSPCTCSSFTSGVYRSKEQNIGCAVGAMLIGGVKKTAEVGLNAQGVEVVTGGLMDPDAEWFTACVQPGKADLITCQIIKAVVAIAQVEIVRIGLEADPAAVNSPEALLLRQIQRSQEQCI